MHYSIITPTICRESLLRTCESIDTQTDGDWEHLIAVDVPLIVRPDARALIDSLPKDSRRKIFRCGQAHRNFGNACRAAMWEKASGDYCYFLDDDNYLADRDVLSRMRAVTGEWALLPILRYGVVFYNDPPEFSKLDTANMLIRAQHARWPNIPSSLDAARMNPAYPADWKLAERLLNEKIPYQTFPEMRPVVVMEKANWGK